jgi:mono/diheme cytochrome c family protein
MRLTVYIRPCNSRHSMRAMTLTLLTASSFLLGFAPTVSVADSSITDPDGKTIYASQCASCHGDRGQGVADHYDSPLIGDLSLEELTKIISETMPEDDPDKCVAADAEAVAKYVYQTFYSAAAREKNSTARVELARLTAHQYLMSTTDLLASFRQPPAEKYEPGLKAEYYTRKDINYTYGLNRKTFERIDDKVDFDFGESGPQPMARQVKDFGVGWSGSVFADRTGEYEFAIKTQNGARLYLNSREPLIDAWVDSQAEPKLYEASTRLIAGRWFPMRLEFHTYQEPTASIQLLWRPPNGDWETIPAKNFAVQSSPIQFVISHDLPPDDSSAGFARGTNVSKSWDDATTRSGIEIMRYVVDNIEDLARLNRQDGDRDAKIKQFCFQFAQRAFRRPLTDEQKQFFVERHFAEAPDIESALKRSILLTLKSPRFLYPSISGDENDDYTIASMLALSLWDSLPDQQLYELAAKGELNDQKVRRQQAARMLNDPRSIHKLKNFLCDWVKIEECSDLAKDATLFPEFNEKLVAQLRTSLEMMFDDMLRREKSDYRNLLLSDEMYISDDIAKFYKLDGPVVHPFEKIKLKDNHYAGIVTHPLLLSTHAYHKSTSPIHRGVFLSRQVLGRTLKPPPDDVEFEDSAFEPSMSMREKVDLLTKPVACQACHQIINPVGYALEHFDSVGRFRTKENEREINAAVELPTPDGKEVKLSNARELAEYAASDRLAQQGFVRQMFQFAIKQPPAAYGSDTIEKLHQKFEKSEFDMKQLFAEIALASLNGNTPDQSPTPSDSE